mmetsp:Transcript_24849/g.63202  ORF Transcript_24849/g.63202 Transcript_24849/m.63202 type:complete len:228 (-) Transcript_24849:870-1553(-)
MLGLALLVLRAVCRCVSAEPQRRSVCAAKRPFRATTHVACRFRAVCTIANGRATVATAPSAAWSPEHGEIVVLVGGQTIAAESLQLHCLCVGLEHARSAQICFLFAVSAAGDCGRAAVMRAASHVTRAHVASARRKSTGIAGVAAHTKRANVQSEVKCCVPKSAERKGLAGTTVVMLFVARASTTGTTRTTSAFKSAAKHSRVGTTFVKIFATWAVARLAVWSQVSL